MATPSLHPASVFHRLSGTLILSTFLVSLAPPPLQAETAIPQPARMNPPANQPLPQQNAPVQPKPSGQESRQAEPTVVLARVEGVVTPEAGGLLRAGAMEVEFPARAVDEPLRVTIEELGQVETLNPGLENTTSRIAGYRVLPHRNFAAYVTVRIPYDRTKIDTAARREALETYYYDEEREVWTKLDKVKVDEERGLVESVTTHFTDFITGTLKLPDSPKPLGFNPTSIKDIKAADPSAGLASLEGLEANPHGSASFQIPLRIPAGRAGMTPELALSYNSGGGGWLGLGFDLGLPSIRIDTRFKLPRYDGNDLYSWNGQELTKVSDDGMTATFRPRVEGGFALISRASVASFAGHQYQWTVIEKNGRKSVYGGRLDGVGGPNAGRDYQWLLTRQEDPNGNWIEWTYTKHQGHLYPASISYTGYGATAGLYRVSFITEERDDRRTDLRGGYSDQMALRLRLIQVSYLGGGSPQVVTQYRMTYGTTTFGKSILTAYQEEDGAGVVFYRYAFDHYSVDKDPATGKVFGFSDPQLWGAGRGDFDASFSTNFSAGVSLSGGLILPINFELGVNASAGGTWGYESSKLMDFNGDGVADILQHNLKSQALYTGGNPGFSLASPGALPWSLVNSATSSQGNASVGIFASGSVGFASASISYSWSWDKSTTDWTYMDIDGDGLVDIIGPAGSYYKNTSASGTVSFAAQSYGSAAVASSDVALPAEVVKRFHLLDPLRMWKAWRPGTVDVSGTIGSTNMDSAWDGVQTWLYATTAGTPASLDTQTLDAAGTATVSKTGLAVNPGDNVTFRLSSRSSVEDDEVSWTSRIRYKTIRLFDDLTNERYGYLLPSYHLTTVSTGSVSGTALPSNLNEYYDYVAHSDTDTSSGVTTEVKTWTLKGSANKAAARQAAILNGNFVYRKLTPEDFRAYGSTTVTNSTTGEESEGNGLAGYYLFDPALERMVLASSFAENDTVLARIHSLMTSHGFAGYPSSLSFPLGIEGTVQPPTGLVASSQSRSHPISTSLPATEPGRWDQTARSVLAESLTGAGGTRQRWIRPYKDAGSWHVEIRQDGDTPLTTTDLWSDGTAITLTDLNETTSSGSGTLALKLEAPRGQKKSFQLTYHLPTVLNQEPAWQAWGGQLVSTLTLAQRSSLINAQPSAALQTRAAAILDRVVDHYTQNPGLSNADQTTVFLAEEAVGMTALVSTLSADQYYAVYDALEIADQIVWAALFPPDETVYTLVSTLTPAERIWVAAQELAHGLVSLPESLSLSQYALVREQLLDEDQTMFEASVTPIITYYVIKAGLADADLAFLLWAETLAGLTADFGLTADGASETYLVKSEASQNTVFTEAVDFHMLYTFSAVAETLAFDSNTVFDVRTVPVSGTVEEYGFGHHLAQGTADVIVLGQFNGTKVEEGYVFVHQFDVETDMSSLDLIGGNQDLPLPKSDVVRAFAGGNAGWFYAEWDGNYAYDETLIRHYLNLSDQKAADTDSVDDTELRDSQVIWAMDWGAGEPFRGLWHGSVASRQETIWNPETRSSSTVVTYNYASNGPINSRPYRVGGDEGLKTAATQDLSSGGGLAWIRNSTSSSQAFSLGGGTPIGGLNSSYSTGSSSGNYDLIDVNGDALPDLIKNNGQVNLNTGNGFSPTTNNWGNDGIRVYDNSGLTLSGSISTSGSVAFKTKLAASGATSGTQADPGSSSNVSMSMGLGASFSLGASYKNRDIMDVNGDGLPDVVRASGNSIVAQLNTGSGFGPGFTLNIPSSAKSILVDSIARHYGLLNGVSSLLGHLNPSDPQQVLSYSGSTTSSVSMSLSGSVSNPVGSLGGSIGGSLSGSTNRAYFDFMDLNGDGLPDLVYKNRAANQLMVCFNLGDRYMEPVVWGSPTSWSLNIAPEYYDPTSGTHQSAVTSGSVPSGAESPWSLTEELSSSTTINASINAGWSYTWQFYFFIPIAPFFAIPFFPFIKAGINGSAGFGTTSVEVTMADVNGDGLPDNVFNMNGTMMVRLNQSGKDGLLKSVTTPQGGLITLEYAQTGNTPDDPNSHWVLSKVTRSDWSPSAVAGTGAASLPNQTFVTSFAYLGGYKDRADRSFWGFSTVTTTQADGRTQVARFANKDVYLKTKPLSVAQYDPSGTLLGRQTTTYNTVTQDVAIGAKGSTWVKVTSVLRETLADGLTLTTETKYAGYDGYGNPTEVEEYLNGTLRQRISLRYQVPGNAYLASLPTLLKVVDGSSGQILRQRTGDYDPKGNLTQQTSSYTATQALTTTLTYDSYGNLLTETDEAGYQLTYQYDPVIHAFVTAVNDNLGQSTGWTYDYSQGLELSQTDTNNQTITKTYDSFGRMTAVRSPYDTGLVPALTFAYDHTSYPWKALTHNKVNYSPDDTQTIATVVLVSGQGQMVQTKKQGLITDPATGTKTAGWIVSPWTVKDNLGREYQKGTPGFDPAVSNTGLYSSTVRTLFAEPDLYTQTSYDSRDRVIDQRLPDGSHQTTEYRLDTWQGNPAWRITATDPEGKKKRTWSDAAELTLAVVQDPDEQAITSTFTYDAIGQMLTATDAGGYTTQIVYDILGRRTSMTNPDTGLMTWEYDAKGDLVKRIDPVLRAKSLDIRYTYDKHRLTKTTYPDSVVTYAYGSDPIAYNVGRLIQTVGDRVTTNSTYGRLGETIGLERIIKTRQAGNPDYTVNLSYAYNYQGQMTNVTYPDGEALTYTYDSAGQVTAIAGTHLGTAFSYVNDIGYDQWGQRVSLALGNGTKTTYTYDPARRWLTNALTMDGTTKLQDLTYRFDRNGNVTSLTTASAAKTTTQTYGYDDLDQLTSAVGQYQNNTYTLAKTASYAQTFAYDRLGNLSRKTSTLHRSPATSADADLNYQLAYTYSTARPHQVNHIGTDHYLYDPNGNLTTIVPDWAWTGETSAPTVTTITPQGPGIDVGDSAIGEDRSLPTATNTTGTRFLTWDWENRLRYVKDDQMEVWYDYDPDGERRLKSLGTVETLYADRMYEVENGSQRQLATVNIYLGDTRLASKVVPLDSPSTGYELQNTYYYHADHIGNSTLITDYQAREYERLSFTPHGEVWQNDSLDTLDKVELLFTGKQVDAETGWYNFGARYLDPKTGLWLSGDPALGEYIPRAPLTKEDKEANGNLPGMGGVYNPVNLALYHFAGNNPIRYTDPDGRQVDGRAIYNQWLRQADPSVLNNPDFDLSDFSNAVDAAAVRGQPLSVGSLNRLAQDRIVINSNPTMKGLAMIVGGFTILITGRLSMPNSGGAGNNNMSSFTTRYLSESGGRWGSSATRQQNYAIATSYKNKGFTVLGGGYGPEEWIAGPGGGTKGGTFVDITVSNGKQTIRLQTVTTKSDGVTPTDIELAAAERIRAAFPNDTLLLIPKE